MNIVELLAGTSPGKIQQVGYMSIIPIIKDIDEQDEQVCDPARVLLGTSSYGSVELENQTDQVAIVPFGVGTITEQRAQDHAVPKAKVLSAKQKSTINYAACIQETQGGYVTKDAHNVTILPWAIKEISLRTRNETSYSKLWPAIRSFNKSLGVRITGHLEIYLKEFKDDLDSFIAQFEIVPGQIGAIILIDGYVMGIELTPNYQYFKSVWNPLIRESYGSLVLQYIKEFGDNPPVPRTRVPMNTNVTSLTELEKELVRVQEEEDERIKNIVRGLLRDDFKVEVDEDLAGYKVQTINNKQFIGQVVTKGDDSVAYLSLVASAEGIRNLSRNQRRSGFRI